MALSDDTKLKLAAGVYAALRDRGSDDFRPSSSTSQPRQKPKAAFRKAAASASAVAAAPMTGAPAR